MDQERIPQPSCDVAVVIPAYNAAEFVLEALDSIIKQTVYPKEVILIDDGSSDETSKIVKEWYENKKPGFAFHLKRQENKGLPATRNVGIRMTAAKWVALLDADDIWEPFHMERLWAAVTAHPEAVAAYGAGKIFSDEFINPVSYDDFWDNPSKTYGEKIPDSPCMKIDSTIFARLIKGNFIKPSSLMFLRSVKGQLMLFNEKLKTAEDREFMVRLVFLGNFIYDPTPITLYRWHDDNISHDKNAKRNIENGLRALKVIDGHRSIGLSPADIKTCEAEVRNQASSYMYLCSQKGWMTYGTGFAFLWSNFGALTACLALNPKHMARCFMSSFAVPVRK